jgi:hypothetical protein
MVVNSQDTIMQCEILAYADQSADMHVFTTTEISPLLNIQFITTGSEHLFTTSAANLHGHLPTDRHSRFR